MLQLGQSLSGSTCCREDYEDGNGEADQRFSCENVAQAAEDDQESCTTVVVRLRPALMDIMSLTGAGDKIGCHYP